MTCNCRTGRFSRSHGRATPRRCCDRDPHLATDIPSRGNSRRPHQDGGVAALSSEIVAILGFVCLFALMLLRVPVGMAMGLVGVTGFGWLTSLGPALKLVSQ